MRLTTTLTSSLDSRTCLRLFYLSTSVKIQFFKTFIMPYFDYCISLLIYFSKSTIQTLSNCFNNCMYNLFKFKIETDGTLFSDDDVNKFNTQLQSYGLFSFQHRLLNKVMIFAHNILNNPFSPPILKEQLQENMSIRVNINLTLLHTFLQL